MRGFIILWLVASAAANKLGYNYQSTGYDAAAAGGAGNGVGIDSSSKNAAFNVHDSRFAGLIDAEATGFSSVASGNAQQQEQELEPTEEFSKEFYTYAAPEEDFADNEATQQIASMLKRNLRVLFIKSPEHQGLTNAALQLAKQASEQRTAIYVLTKQADIGQLAQRLQSEAPSEARKPEVHFVKYRTPEEATRAQQLIQQQFEALGGSSRSSDEGVAPVLDFSSATPDRPQSTYLPTEQRRR